MTLWARIVQERKRVLVPLALGLLVNVAVLVAAVLPLRSAIAATEARSIEAMRALADARRLDHQAAQAKASRLRADEELRTFYTKVLPSSFQAAETTTNLWLAQAARQAGLQFKGSHFEWNEVRDTALSRTSARITLEGTYPSIRRFLYDVENAEEFIIVERVELADQSEQPGAAGRLEVSLIVSTYFPTTPGS
ncbi:MAG: type 4a pilus biogenesis protein PilO [Acidobacteria bacterium]|nr:type 4a pilus biogenesis protein PilO [Acidobacteriota bacterium]